MALVETVHPDVVADAIADAVRDRLRWQLSGSEFDARIEQAADVAARILSAPFCEDDLTDTERCQALAAWAESWSSDFPDVEFGDAEPDHRRAWVNDYHWLRFDDDLYVSWVGSCDAPGYALTLEQLLEARLDTEHLARLLTGGHTYQDREGSVADLVAFNRAGPDESCLTFDALVRYVRDRESFELRPEDINPIRTNDWDAEGNEIIVWTPWRPGEAPERIDDSTDLNARVPEFEGGPEPA